MSTATALAAHDCIPGDEMELLNQMHVLVLTRGNGTPFDAAYIQEEDITELCVQIGQTHPKGVLQILVMAHGVTKAMVLHEEPIRFHTIPPSTAQGLYSGKR